MRIDLSDGTFLNISPARSATGFCMMERKRWHSKRTFGIIGLGCAHNLKTIYWTVQPFLECARTSRRLFLLEEKQMGTINSQKKAAETLRERYGQDYFSKLARKGGQAAKDSDRGDAVKAALLEKYGPDYYSNLVKQSHAVRRARKLVVKDVIIDGQNAKAISLTKGEFAIIDTEDLPLVTQHSWYVKEYARLKYAVREVKSGGKKHTIKMHRAIAKANPGEAVDHINGNGLDNRKSNLRICTGSQNAMNQRPQLGRTSKYKGVYRHKGKNKWIASIGINRKVKSIGSFNTELEAAKAYDNEARKLFGEYARVNFPDEQEH